MVFACFLRKWHFSFLSLTNNTANIRLSEDVLKTSSRRLQCNIFCLPRRLEDIIARRLANTSWRRLEDVLKTSWRCLARRLEDILGRCIADTSWRRLEDVFKRSWKTKNVTLKTSWKTRNVCWVTTLSKLRMNNDFTFYATGVDNFGPSFVASVFDSSMLLNVRVTLHTCTGTPV